MRRREFILGLGGAVTWPLAARPQQPAIPVVGVLRSGGAPTELLERVTRFRQGLKQTNIVDGENVAIKDRYETDMLDRAVRASMLGLVRASPPFILSFPNYVHDRGNG
jgi:hypothetical protein